jgi:hypothetical protein
MVSGKKLLVIGCQHRLGIRDQPTSADAEVIEGSEAMILVGLIIIVAVVTVLMMRRSRGKL